MSANTENTDPVNPEPRPEPAKVYKTIDFDSVNLIDYYNGMIGLIQYEGGGLWNRFNIMIGINISLFGLETFVYSTSLDHKNYFLITIAVVGFLFALWSLYVLQKLWKWHYHWGDILRGIEKHMPPELPKPFTGVPNKLKRRITWYHLWIKAYTQPFFIVIGIAWLLLIFLNVMHKAPDEKTNIDIKHPKSEIIKVEPALVDTVYITNSDTLK